MTRRPLLLAGAVVLAAGCSSTPAPDAQMPPASQAGGTVECAEVVVGASPELVGAAFPGPGRRITPAADSERHLELAFPSSSGGICVVSFEEGRASGPARFDTPRYALTSDSPF